MTDLERAKARFAEGSYTCVLCRDDVLYTSARTGVAPLMEWIAQGVDLRGFAAADKIVGKAQAMLAVLAGLKEVFAPVMSRSGRDYLERHGVGASCDTLVPLIVNRQGTGSCPMEAAVAAIERPDEGLRALQERVRELSCPSAATSSIQKVGAVSNHTAPGAKEAS